MEIGISHCPRPQSSRRGLRSKFCASIDGIKGVFKKREQEVAWNLKLTYKVCLSGIVPAELARARAKGIGGQGPGRLDSFLEPGACTRAAARSLVVG